MINRLGENKYKGLYSLIALAGLLIIIYGFGHADFHPVWDPLPYNREIVLALMPNAIIVYFHQYIAGVVIFSTVSIGENFLSLIIILTTEFAIK